MISKQLQGKIGEDRADHFVGIGQAKDVVGRFIGNLNVLGSTSQIRMQESALASGCLTGPFAQALVPSVPRAAAEARPSCLMKSLRMMDSGRFMSVC